MIDLDGLVKLQNWENATTAPPVPPGRRYMKRLETAETLRTETNSSLDSSSVRSDDNLDEFLDQDFPNFTDTELLDEFEAAVECEKLVLVGYYLKEMENRGLSLSDAKRQAALQRATNQIEETIETLGQDADKGGNWTKKGLMHGRDRDTMVYHRTNEKGEVTVRCETPIQASLVAPLLSILNETDLYTTWCPKFERPFKLGVRDTGKLKQCSRASQVAYAKVDMPWPLNNREVIAKNTVAEAVDEVGALVVRAKTMETGEEVEGLVIPPCEPGHDRITMDASLLIRKCPADHPTLKRHSTKKNRKRTSADEKNEDDEPLLLATFTLFVTPSVNAVLKVIAGPLWGALIGFADDVQNGKKGAAHRERIEEKAEFYGWVNETVERMTNKCA